MGLDFIQNIYICGQISCKDEMWTILSKFKIPLIITLAGATLYKGDLSLVLHQAILLKHLITNMTGSVAIFNGKYSQMFLPQRILLQGKPDNVPLVF